MQSDALPVAAPNEQQPKKQEFIISVNKIEKTGQLLIEFNHQVAWFMLDPEEARQLGQRMIEVANELELDATTIKKARRLLSRKLKRSD